MNKALIVILIQCLFVSTSFCDNTNTQTLAIKTFTQQEESHLDFQDKGLDVTIRNLASKELGQLVEADVQTNHAKYSLNESESDADNYLFVYENDTGDKLYYHSEDMSLLYANGSDISSDDFMDFETYKKTFVSSDILSEKYQSNYKKVRRSMILAMTFGVLTILGVILYFSFSGPAVAISFYSFSGLMGLFIIYMGRSMFKNGISAIQKFNKRITLLKNEHTRIRFFLPAIFMLMLSIGCSVYVLAFYTLPGASLALFISANAAIAVCSIITLLSLHDSFIKKRLFKWTRPVFLVMIPAFFAIIYYVAINIGLITGAWALPYVWLPITIAATILVLALANYTMKLPAYFLLSYLYYNHKRTNDLADELEVPLTRLLLGFFIATAIVYALHATFAFQILFTIAFGLLTIGLIGKITINRLVPTGLQTIGLLLIAGIGVYCILSVWSIAPLPGIVLTWVVFGLGAASGIKVLLIPIQLLLKPCGFKDMAEDRRLSSVTDKSSAELYVFIFRDILFKGLIMIVLLSFIASSLSSLNIYFQLFLLLSTISLDLMRKRLITLLVPKKLSNNSSRYALLSSRDFMYHFIHNSGSYATALPNIGRHKALGMAIIYLVFKRKKIHVEKPDVIKPFQVILLDDSDTTTQLLKDSEDTTLYRPGKLLRYLGWQLKGLFKSSPVLLDKPLVVCMTDKNDPADITAQDPSPLVDIYIYGVTRIQKGAVANHLQSLSLQEIDDLKQSAEEDDGIIAYSKLGINTARENEDSADSQSNTKTYRKQSMEISQQKTRQRTTVLSVITPDHLDKQQELDRSSALLTGSADMSCAFGSNIIQVTPSDVDILFKNKSNMVKNINYYIKATQYYLLTNLLFSFIFVVPLILALTVSVQAYLFMELILVLIVLMGMCLLIRKLFRRQRGIIISHSVPKSHAPDDDYSFDRNIGMNMETAIEMESLISPDQYPQLTLQEISQKVPITDPLILEIIHYSG